MPAEKRLDHAKEKQYVLEQWMIDRIKEIAKQSRKSESEVVRELLGRALRTADAQS